MIDSEQVVAIFCGYPEAAREAAQSWLELLVAQLLHSFPALTLKAGLPSLLDRCLSDMGSTDTWQLSTLQQILEAGFLLTTLSLNNLSVHIGCKDWLARVSGSRYARPKRQMP